MQRAKTGAKNIRKKKLVRSFFFCERNRRASSCNFLAWHARCYWWWCDVIWPSGTERHHRTVLVYSKKVGLGHCIPDSSWAKHDTGERFLLDMVPQRWFFPSTTGTVVSWKWLKLEVFIELFLQNNYGTLAPSSYSTPPGIIGLCLFDMSPEKLLLAIAYLVLCFLLIDVLCIIFQLYKFCNRLSFRTIQNGICLLYRATSTSYLLKR